MVVGDVVNGVFDGVTLLVFRPALGVEVCLTHLSSWGNSFRLTDGVANGDAGNGANSTVNLGTTKIMITNAIWITANSPGAPGSEFTGIQLK
jgi:hypothetical protein